MTDSPATARTSLYDHGFVRVAAAVPHVRPADPAFNAERTVELAQWAVDDGAGLVVFPELGISAYAIDDLLGQRALLDAAVDALQTVVQASADWPALIAVGVPLRTEQGLFN